MNLNDSTVKSLQLASNSNIITDDVFKKLLENCFSILSGRNEIHNLTGLYNSKPDVIKELYAALLKFLVEARRHNVDRIESCLPKSLTWSLKKVEALKTLHDENKINIDMSLSNIGSHLEHVIDVKWKLEYVIKSNILDESTGPWFRVALITEKQSEGSMKQRQIEFICDAQELQDLVYKFKDALKHCQKFVS